MNESRTNQLARWGFAVLSLVLALPLITRAASVGGVGAGSQEVLAKTNTKLLETSNDDANLNTRNAAESFVGRMCPNMLQHVFEDVTPHDEAKAGTFEKIHLPPSEDGEVDLSACLAACCSKERNDTCNVVFVYKRTCYHVHCISNEACLPKQRPEVKERLQMILVNPVKPTDTNIEDTISWLDVLKTATSKGEGAESNVYPLEELNAERTPERLSFWNKPHKYHYATRNQESAMPAAYDDDDEFPLATEKRMKQLLFSSVDDSDNIIPEEVAFYTGNAGTMPKYITCDLEINSPENRCPAKEECMPERLNAAIGICKCMRGYIRNQLRECVRQETADDYPHFEEIAAASAPLPRNDAALSNKKINADNVDTSTAPEAISNKKILVKAESKEVRLPEKQVTLSANTEPADDPTNPKYSYLWTLIAQPKGPMNGTISDQSKAKVKLSNLSEGLYTFKVSVTGENDTNGEAMANVTVLPEKRINKLPQVIISPAEQTIRKPTSNAVLDGSPSFDDDKIVNWYWEVVSAPIGYQPKLPEVATLQLTDLIFDGNYTFKLTLTDSDNMTNSTTANITVLKGTDYPPVANAGDGVILYLPNNNVTLNGTASSDDHEIVAWEWTKDASDEAKAVDMQNTRTPYVQLSNLEEGMYTFVLKVTDGSGQSSSAKVHVFVKPPTNSPPVANAGKNATINLPQNWIILNGSQSTDDIGIEKYIWSQKSGPNHAVIKNANSSLANATSLTLGLYEFVLKVIDVNNNTSNASVWIKIVQEKNAAPIAKAGGDQTVTLPVSAVYLNGSNSWDDLAVTKYIWSRDDDSLAAGTVIGDSDKQPVLILTNLANGHYIFKLTVSDEQGLSSVDTVNVVVQQDPLLLNLVEITLPTVISQLTTGELNTIVQKIGLLLGDMKVIHTRELKPDTRSEGTILIFYVESLDSDGKTHPVDGLAIEQLLKEKLQRDASILGTPFGEIRTTICQNKCSSHGVCNEASRACICEAFWMPSLGYLWGFSEANCDWSILYVFVGIILIFALLAGLFWSIACSCRQPRTKPKTRAKRPKVQKYSLIGNHDEEAPRFSRTSSLTDSETDSDVLFETRSKQNAVLRSNGSANGKKHSKFGSSKLGRKIKA